jgi:hypothetical protein
VADPVGRSKYDSLQVKLNRRFANGLTLSGFATWSKGFSTALDQYPGARIWNLDAQPAAVYSLNWASTLPFGNGKQFLNGQSRAVSAIVSGWKINGFLKYNSGTPLGIAGGSTGNLGALGYSPRGNAVVGVSPYLVTDPGAFDPARDRFLNSGAFAFSTGYNFGNLGQTLSWVRGFWGKQEALTVGRTFALTERVAFDLSVDATNPFNITRWNNPSTNLLSPAFGRVTSSQAGRTMQVNAQLKF